MADVITTLTGKNSALNRQNDTYPGGGDSPGAHPGQLLKTKRLTKAQALQLSDTAIGTLYAGVYQYVQTLSTMTQAAVVGQLCFWKTAADYENGIVTGDGGVTVEGRCAGVFINVIDKGSYGWIQVDGEATVKCKATVTDTTDGNLAVVTTTTFTTDSIADAGTIATALAFKNAIGVFLEAAANGALKKVLLKYMGRNF